MMPIARQLSPVIAARALELAAAQARVTVAGALPDPTVRILSDEIDRISGPRQNKMVYSAEQEFPLWGKRELRRQAANAEADQAAAEGRSTEAQLVEKVKTAFAQYYIADRAVAVTADLQAAAKAIVDASQARYAQGQGAQTDVLRAQAEALRAALYLADDGIATAGYLALALGKPLLPYVLEAVFHLDDEGWRKLTFRWGVFFFFLAGLNEVIWRTQSTDFWVAFKVWGVMPLTILFTLLQTPMMLRHGFRTEEDEGN
ncbi:MAG TPA: septation protein IspZ [Rhabdaerophilum sp.]|nr:septation protein IspZ [Rhabdaerophilum sp.]